jgi:Family of unknown function (DUF6335)
MRGIDSLDDLDQVGVDIDGELLDVAEGRSGTRGHSSHAEASDIAGADFDDEWDLEELYGDESGGANRTPDQNVVDELGEAIGVTYDADEELWFGTKEGNRDRHRWELDPASAEDWSDRKRR